MKCPLCDRDISTGMLTCGSHKEVPLSTNPDPLQSALTLAQEQLQQRSDSLKQAAQAISELVASLQNLSSALMSAQTALSSAIATAQKVQSLLGGQ